MHLRTILTAVIVLLCACFALAPSATLAQAAADPAQGTVWDLTLLYPDKAAWEKERAAVEASLPEIAQLKGTLGSSAESLQVALERISKTRQRLDRLSAYAHMKADEDTSIPENQARVQAADALGASFDEATAFVDPEILAVGRARIEAFEQADAGLGLYRRQLELVLRRAPHTLGPEAEGVIAASSFMRGQPNNVHDIFMYADAPWPTMEINGKTVRLDPQGYSTVLFNPDRAVRRKAFELYLATLTSYQRTFGAVLSAFLSGPAFEARVRHYPSSLALALNDDAMPEEPFQTLMAEIDKAVPIVQRYLRVRKQVLGIDELRLYDLSVPLATDKRRYQLDQAEDFILQALAPLGPQYVQQLSTDFHSHSMHATVQPNKRDGAYTNGAYGVLPFVLLSFTGDYESVSTVAHEWGHAMHSQFAESAQPYETADYSAFVADTPSLTNEMMLSDYMIAHATTKDDKILTLSQGIDLLRTYYFGVALYARFELAAHQAADRSEPLTGQRFGEMYCGLLEHLYGESAITMNPADCAIWANLRAVYWNFYVYKYMTATSAAAYFVESLEKNDPEVRSRYFELLKAGGSDDPYLLLKRAGFDAALPTAYQPMIRRLDRLVTELEAALAQPAQTRAAVGSQR